MCLRWGTIHPSERSSPPGREALGLPFRVRCHSGRGGGPFVANASGSCVFWPLALTCAGRAGRERSLRSFLVHAPLIAMRRADEERLAAPARAAAAGGGHFRNRRHSSSDAP